MVMLHKEDFMKKNILIGLLLAFTMLLITACGSNSNDTSKFNGTWIAYNKDKGVAELTIESLDKQAIVTLTNYSYKALTSASSSGLIDAQLLKNTGETGIVHADYLLQKNVSSIHNVLGSVANNRLTIKSDKSDFSILYNEKDDTLIIENIVFHKQSDDNSVKTYLPKMQDAIKNDNIEKNKEYMKDRIQKPTIQFDFSFDDSILDGAQ